MGGGAWDVGRAGGEGGVGREVEAEHWETLIGRDAERGEVVGCFEERREGGFEGLEEGTG